MSGNFLFEWMIALRVALAFPGVVDGDVDVTGIAHAVAGDGVGHAADDFIADAPVEFVPAIPAHRRSARESVIGNLVQSGHGHASGQRAVTGRDPMGGERACPAIPLRTSATLRSLPETIIS